jgi:protease secretion system outer membrane protein
MAPHFTRHFRQVFIAGAIVTMSQAALASDLTLGRVLNLALAHSRTVRKESLEVENAQLNVAVMRAKARPTVIARGSANFARESGEYQFSNASSAINSIAGIPTYVPSQSASVTLVQPLYHGGGIRAEIRGARELSDAERAKLLSVTQQVIQGVVDDYAAVMKTTAELAWKADTARLKGLALEEEERKFQRGSGTRGAVAAARRDLAEAEVETAAATTNAHAARLVLGEDIGEPVDNVADLDIASTSHLEASEASVNNAVEASPDVAAAKHSLAAAEDDLTVSRAQTRPQIDLNAVAERDNNARGVERSSNFGALIVQMSLPLYAGGGLKARIAQSRIAIRERTIDVDDARAKIRLILLKSISDYQNLVKEERQSLQSVEQAETALMGARKQFDAGEIDREAVIEKEEALDDVRSRLAEIRADLLSSYYTAQLSLGRVSLDDGALIASASEHEDLK